MNDSKPALEVDTLLAQHNYSGRLQRDDYALESSLVGMQVPTSEIDRSFAHFNFSGMLQRDDYALDGSQQPIEVLISASSDSHEEWTIADFIGMLLGDDGSDDEYEDEEELRQREEICESIGEIMEAQMEAAQATHGKPINGPANPIPLHSQSELDSKEMKDSSDWPNAQPGDGGRHQLDVDLANDHHLGHDATIELRSGSLQDEISVLHSEPLDATMEMPSHFEDISIGVHRSHSSEVDASVPFTDAIAEGRHLTPDSTEFAINSFQAHPLELHQVENHHFYHSDDSTPLGMHSSEFASWNASEIPLPPSPDWEDPKSHLWPQ
jgi:hypothetical protein